MRPTMRKSSTSKKQASMGAGKESTVRRPQRGLGVAELERIRLQEERLLYHASHHHLMSHQQHAADSCSPHYNLHYKQLPFFSFNPNLPNPNPNFMPSNPNSNAEAPTFISHIPQAAPSLQLLANPNLNTAPPSCNPKSAGLLQNSCDFMLSSNSSSAAAAPPPTACQSKLVESLAAKLPGLVSTHFTANLAAANPNIAPFHNTNPDLKIPNVSRDAQPWPNSAALMEHSFFPLHGSSSEAAGDIIAAQPSLVAYHAAAADGCTVEGPPYHAPSFTLETPPSPSVHDHTCKTSKKNTPALQDAEELELPSFQSMVFKEHQQSIRCDYENHYMKCNLDLNNAQGEYELTYNAETSLQMEITSSGGISTVGGATSPRDDFLKLGLPTITEEWNQGRMQTLEHFHEHSMTPRMEVCYGQMLKGNKINLDLELKLSLPSFGYQ